MNVKVEEGSKKLVEEENKKFRSLRGRTRLLEMGIGVLISVTGMIFVLNLPLLFGVSLFSQQYLGFFLGLLLALAFLIVPAGKKSPRTAVPWYDFLLAFLSILIGVYILICYPALAASIGIISTYKVVIGTVTILLILEGTRRLTGMTLVVVVVCFLCYYQFGYLLTGLLQVPPVPYGRIVTQLFLGADSIFGVALRIAAMVVFAFILFSQVLFSTGGAAFLFGIAEAAMGRYRGGTAKAGILASGLFGMISGSAVANVAATGTLTIPMMKKVGYTPHFAAAVNSVAATGGVIAPPIMGAAAFIIAEFLRVGYAEVVYIAIVPAVLYYLSLFIQVDLRSAKDNIKGMPADSIPSMRKILKEGWFFIIPVIVLVYAIFVLYSRPESGAFYSMVVILVISVLKKDIRAKLNLKEILNILESTSRGMLETAIVCGSAGLVIGVMSYSGLGQTLSNVLIALSGDNLLLLSIMTAIASIILGMGMPLTASYLLLAILVCPAMVNSGVPPLIAHMFVFYFGAFSFLTPPVCLATYAAASIAGADFMKTAWQGIWLAIPGFVVPFIFIFNPAVALIGTPVQIAREISFAIIAVLAVSIALEGFLKKRLNILQRIIFGAVGCSLFLPLPLIASIIATTIFVVMVAMIYMSAGKPRLGNEEITTSNDD